MKIVINLYSFSSVICLNLFNLYLYVKSNQTVKLTINYMKQIRFIIHGHIS